MSSCLVKDSIQILQDWEITAASEKLAECQETILNLGKQLKALSTPSDAVLFDKVISTSDDTKAAPVTTMTSTALSKPKDKIMNQRSSLLDHLLAEDNAAANNKSPKVKESDNYSSAFFSNEVIESLEKILSLDGTKHQDDEVAVSSLAIVPSKKRGGASLWRKLLWRKRKSNSRKPPFPFAP